MRQVLRLFIVFFLVASNGFLVQNISAQSISLERNKASLFSGSSIGFADGSALSAQFNLPTGIAPDTFGNIYIADYSNHSIRKINALGVVTTIAGNGTAGFADGQDTAARFNGPTGITCDLAGNIYVADQMNNRIRKITPTGLVSIYAGDGFIGALDGPASSARFNFPIGIACDTAGNLFVADQYNHKIRKINAAGIVSTLCGDGVSGFVNGTGLVSRFSMPTGIAVDLAGNVFVADYGNHSIRKVTSTGQSSTYAGTGASGYKDTLSIFSQFSTPSGLFCDMNGDVIVADRSNQKIRRISPNGIVSTIAGSFWGSANGIGSAAQFANPYSLSKNINGDFIIADGGNNQIRRLSAISLDSFFATIYGFSAPKNISIRGVGLSGNLKVFAPTGFQVSLLSGAGYADSLELTPISGEITQELYFRLQSNTSGVYSGDVIVSSPSSTTLQIPLKGRVNCAIVGAVSPGGSSTTNYNQPTSIQFSQSGLFAPTWSTTGSLPTGISMNSATGEISGSPTQTGTFNFIVLASAGGCNLSNAYSLFVNGTPTALFNHIANSCANRNVQFTDSSVLDTSWLWNFGDGTFSTIQNPLHTYASDSVYTVTLQINGASGPQTSKQISVATTPTTPTISSSNSCNYVYTFSGAPTGYGYRYAWSFAPGSSGNGDTIRIPNRTYASSGSTTVNLTVSAQGSCSVSAAPFVFMANQNTVGVTAAMSLTGDICSNQRTLSNTSSGSGTVFSYSLDGSAYATITGSQLFSSLSGGVHLVKLAAHDNSCFDTTSTSFTVSSVVVNFSSDSNTCNQIVNFSNSSSVSFGSASYLWQFGVPVKDSSTLTNPSYDFVSKLSDSTTLRITAASGCVATLRKATAVGQGTAPVPNFDIILDSNYCSNRYRFLNTTANTSGVSYVWDFGNGNGSTLANPIHSYGDTGVYLVKLNVTSAACVNPIVKTKVLPIPYGTNWPNPFFTTNNNVQNFATQNFNFNNTSTYVGSGYIMRYFWDFGDGTYDSTHTSIYGKTYAAAGIYTVTLRAQSWQGCFNQYSQTVEVTPMLTAKFGYTQNLCVDRVINFKDSSTLATSYFWNFGDGDTSTLQNPVHVFRKDSVYTVTLQVNGGPIFTKTITVSIAPPVPSLTYSNTCNFDYTFLGAPAGNFYRYAWNFDAGSSGNGDTVQIPNRRYSFNGSTTVQLTVFSLGNCLSVSSPLVFTASQYKVGVNADFTLTGDVCSNQRLLTNASTGSGSVFSISYDGLPFINYTIPVLISSLTSGRHDFVFAAHDSSCFDTAYSSVVVSNVVVNFKSDSNTCNQQVAFTNQSVVAFGTAKYLWEFGSPIKDTSTQTNPVFNFQSATVDSTTLTVLAESGCTASLKKVTAVGVGLMPNPQILVTRDPGLCSNNFRFSNISTYHPTATYTWSFGDGSFSNDSSIIHTYADTGFYQVELRSSSPNCAQPIIATSSANVPSTVNFPIPNFTINNDTQTYTNQNFQLLNTSIFRGPGFITNYYWNFSDGSYDSVNTSLYAKTFGQPGIYTITLSAKSWLGCINQISQKVVVTPVVISKFGYSGNTCSSRTVSFRDSSSLAAKYKWYFGDGDTSILPNPIHTYSKDSIYRVYLVINDTVYSTQLLTVATTPVLTSVVALKDCGNKYTLAGAPGGYGLNYAWNLGGGLGSDSTFQIPVVYYNSGGLKTVSVSVNSYGLCPISSSLHSFTAQPISTANIARLSLSAPGSDFCTNDRILTNNSNPGSTYTYSIDNGVFAPIATSISLNGLATGYHSVKVKAENGSCVDIAEKGFFISTPTASFVSSPSACNQVVNFTNTSSTSDNNGYSAIWKFGSPVKDSSFDISPAFDFKVPGLDSVSVTVTSSSGCSATIKQPVTVGAGTTSLKANFSFSQMPGVCGNKFQFIDSTTGGTGLTYDWDFGDGTTSPLQNPVKSFADTGWFTVTLTAKLGICYHTISKDVYVQPNAYGPAAAFRINNPIQIIVGNSFNFINESKHLGPGYIAATMWTFGDGQKDSLSGSVFDKRYTSPGTFMVTLITTSSLGCIDSSSAQVLVQPIPLSKFDYITNSCANRSVQFIDSSLLATNYQWDFGDGDSSSLTAPLHVYANDGVYVVTLTINGGIVSQKTITVATTPTAVFTATPNNCLNKYQFQSFDIGPTYTYQWRFSNGLANDSLISNPQVTFSSVGNTYVNLRVTSGGRCFKDALEDTIATQVGVISSFQITVSDSCSNNRTIINKSTSGSTFMLALDSGAFTTYSTAVNYLNLSAGQHFVRFVALDINCSDTSIQYFYINNLSGSFASLPANCSPMVDFISSISTDDGSAPSYAWDFAGDGNSNQKDPRFIFLSSGKRLVKLIATAQGGCKKEFSDSVQVNSSTGPDATFTVTEVRTTPCQSGFNFTSTSVKGTQFYWSFGDGLVSDQSTIRNIFHTYIDTGSFEAVMVAISPLGCVTVSDTSMVKVTQAGKPSPVAYFTTNDTVQCFSKQNFNLVNGSTLNGAGWINQFKWDFGDGKMDSFNVTVYGKKYTSLGSFTIRLTATTNLGCSHQFSKVVRVVHDSNCATPVGLAQINPELGWKVYPNPNNGQFIFGLNQSAKENIHIQIRDMLGREMGSNYLIRKGEQQIELHENLSPGRYVLEGISTNGYLIRQVFVVAY